MATKDLGTDIGGYCLRLAEQARIAGRTLSIVSGRQRDLALHRIADRIEQRAREIVEANGCDLEVADSDGRSEAFKGKLTLDATAVGQISDAVRQIADQVDPVGQVIEGRVLANGIRLQKMRVPIGVVLIIYESRPNVTSDAAALCLKSGNAVILRGGKEARHSNVALAACIRAGLEAAGLDTNVVQFVEISDRAAVGKLLQLEGLVDLCIPRGGESLIRAVVEQSRIPVIKHYTGNCHVYVDDQCDEQMTMDLCINAKTQRPGVCNAAETLLFHHGTVESGLLGRVCEELSNRDVQVRGDAQTCAAYPPAELAGEEDWRTEYLDLIVAVRVVDGVTEAVDHINMYGSHHTDAIVTNDLATAESFAKGVDSANVFINCSTRFSDGGQYGLGAEIGISTDKLHARGPMGAADLTTYKWIARGEGQLRD